jgi:hypothetical protein
MRPPTKTRTGHMQTLRIRQAGHIASDTRAAGICSHRNAQFHNHAPATRTLTNISGTAEPSSAELSTYTSGRHSSSCLRIGRKPVPSPWICGYVAGVPLCASCCGSRGLVGVASENRQVLQKTHSSHPKRSLSASPPLQQPTNLRRTRSSLVASI